VRRSNSTLRSGRRFANQKDGVTNTQRRIAHDARMLTALSASLRAKRSNPSIRSLRHGLLRFARNGRHIELQMWLRDLAAQCARGLLELSPSEATRGRREDRVRAAPAVSCARLCEEAHTSIQVQRKHSGLPRAMVLRLISRSPWRPAFLPPSPSRALPQDLTPASGCQNHTTSPSAIGSVRLTQLSRPPHPTARS